MFDTRLLTFVGKKSLASMEPENALPMNDSGVDRRPTNKEREKFRVANVARNMPKSSREND